MKTKQGFIVADLGGGTLDFSIYKICGQKPLEVKEVDAPKCVIEGSVLVTQRASKFLKGKCTHLVLGRLQTDLSSEKLKNSPYGDEKAIEEIYRKFDETTKLVFRSKTDTCFVAFGSSKDNDTEHGIRGGRLRLSGYVYLM